ncbi:MAG: LysM peptidoglycan-binding domain-containing M23 family metallopeptidase [Pseudomonadota bacterium]
MTPSFGRRVARGAMMAAISLAVAACAGRQDPGDAEVEIRGTDPSGGSSSSAGRAAATQPLPDGAGIVAYDGYAAARAQEGDTVSTLASRVGLSASELGAYNGLAPTHQLRAGDELVLPPRPGGYVATAAPAPDLAPAAVPVSGIEAQPLDASGAGLPTTTGTEIAAADPATAPLPADSGWSPELIAGAIDRTGGPETPQTETPGQGVALPAPPSAGDPLPPEPSGTETLQSPQLSQYQTSRPDETVVARAPDPSVDPVPVPTPAPADALPVASDSDPATSEVAAATPAPAAAAPTTRLQRPVQGEVALGFREGAGGVKNDGVDFAAPAGAPVVAAEAGEVALVSEALGGLGTIVLLRHPGELLTVYGRISGVTVSKGDIVERGQQIGEVAQPDGGVAPRMHFEVREGAASVDPMRYI